jgi:hypothetical protein
MSTQTPTPNRSNVKPQSLALTLEHKCHTQP